MNCCTQDCRQGRDCPARLKNNNGDHFLPDEEAMSSSVFLSAIIGLAFVLIGYGLIVWMIFDGE